MAALTKALTLVLVAGALLLQGAGTGWTAGPPPVVPKPADKCPVCGMFVAKYPDFLAQVIYTDGTYALFDGAKDLFKYLFALDTYAAGRNRADIASVYVTDYYSLSPVDGRTAWYVVGSDVYGPMGRELIPFAREAEAREFLQDHAGIELLRFDGVTPAIIGKLD